VGVTSIEWTAAPRPDGTFAPGYTFNGWRGCQKVSPECKYCYAEAGSKRNPAVLGKWGPGSARVIGAEDYWGEPRKWDREAARAGERRRVFCLSYGDVFEDRDDLVAPRQRLFSLIAATPHLDWLLLTKRPENVFDLVPDSWCPRFPPNVWAGVSVGLRDYAWRIDLLRRFPAVVRFLSLEPLLEDLGDLDLSGIHWAVAGGESVGGRPCRLSWLRSIIRQCHKAAVPCFVKQLGSNAWEDGGGGPHRLRLRDGKGGDMAEWPDDLRVREQPALAKVTVAAGHAQTTR
jgi:protein gp37